MLHGSFNREQIFFLYKFKKNEYLCEEYLTFSLFRKEDVVHTNMKKTILMDSLHRLNQKTRHTGALCCGLGMIVPTQGIKPRVNPLHAIILKLVFVSYVRKFTICLVILFYFYFFFKQGKRTKSQVLWSSRTIKMCSPG